MVRPVDYIPFVLHVQVITKQTLLFILLTSNGMHQETNSKSHYVNYKTEFTARCLLGGTIIMGIVFFVSSIINV